MTGRQNPPAGDPTATDDSSSAPPAAPDAFFLCRLLPPRPTFVQDMTPEEGQVMQAHAAYWQALLAQGIAIVFGPVLDPKGPGGSASSGPPARRRSTGWRATIR